MAKSTDYHQNVGRTIYIVAINSLLIIIWRKCPSTVWDVKRLILNEAVKWNFLILVFDTNYNNLKFIILLKVIYRPIILIPNGTKDGNAISSKCNTKW